MKLTDKSSVGANVERFKVFSQPPSHLFVFSKKFHELSELTVSNKKKHESFFGTVKKNTWNNQSLTPWKKISLDLSTRISMKNARISFLTQITDTEKNISFPELKIQLNSYRSHIEREFPSCLRHTPWRYFSQNEKPPRDIDGKIITYFLEQNNIRHKLIKYLFRSTESKKAHYIS